ncbi:MAG: glucose-6-phosphate isomerase [Bdellovibrionales bacterium]
MIDLRHIPSLSDSLTSELMALWPKMMAGQAKAFVGLADDNENWEAINNRLDQCRGVERALVVGIGGSSLGTQVIYEAFRASSAARLFFLEAVDPYKWDTLRIQRPEWRDSHVVIVSKTGSTLETLSWVEKLANLDTDWLNPQNCTIIASPTEGPLQQFAQKNSIPCLWLPNEVGGRFSVLSAVGMYPAGLMGLSCHEFREGARWAVDRQDLVVSLAASAIAAWKRQEWITQLWVYSEALRTFGQWWQQLWSESLGKRLTRDGSTAPRVSTPMPCMGPRDQHSLLQQLIEGHRDKQVILTRILSVDHADEPFPARMFPSLPFSGRSISLGQVLGAEARAFEKSLVDSKIPYSAMQIEKISEASLGGLFMVWQLTIALLGEYLNIDAFNQPGVELGKRHVEKILRE